MRTLSRSIAAVLAACCLLGAPASCRPFAIHTPPGMLELDGQTDYDYRAMTPDGVVLAVRAIKGAGKADVAFWTQAVTLHMKELSGYALLGTADVKTSNGVVGKELQFGHDESGKPYAYIVRLFVSDERLFLVEAGGTKEEVDKARPTLDAAMASLQVK